MSGIRFRSKWGVTPNTTKLEFTFTSAMLEEFLRAKVQEITNMLIAKGIPKEKTVDPNDLYVRADEIGRNFAPLFIGLPPEVLRQNQYNANVPEMFQNIDSEFVPLNRAYWELLRRFTFSKRDVESIRSRNIQRLLGVRRPDNIRNYIAFTTPKIIYQGNPENKVVDKVCFYADPNPMIHEMLTNEMNRRERFETSMKDTIVYKQTDTAIYVVERKVVKGDKKHGGNDRTPYLIAERMPDSK